MDTTVKPSQSSTYISNIKSVFSSEKKDMAAQGLVPTILLIAGFAAVAILAVTWIGNSIAWKAQLEARCIAQVEGFETLNGSPGSKCIGTAEEYKGEGIIAEQINSTKGSRF